LEQAWIRAFTSSDESGSGGSFLPLLAGTWSVTAELIIVGLEVVSGFASSPKRPSIATLLADPAEVKQKRYYLEKMGWIPSGADSPWKSGRLHASSAGIPKGRHDGLRPVADGGGSRKGP
jgi:hypothetical protein